MAGINVQSHRFDLRKSAGQEAGFVFKVNKITAHPNYSDVTQANDVAVWKVALVQGEASKLPLTTLNFDDGLSSQTGANQTIAGWGTTSSSGSLSKIMLETIVTISQAAYCVKAYPSGIFLLT